MPGECPDARTKPLPLANGHGRHKTIHSNGHLLPFGNGRCAWRGRHEFTTVSLLKLKRSLPTTAASLLKPPCGGFRIETVTWIQKWFNCAHPVRRIGS
jgi:hypothetical protein